jgi:hypothetical protein
MNFRSTTAVRFPSLAIVQATNLPPVPLPRTRTSYSSGSRTPMISFRYDPPFTRQSESVLFGHRNAL